MKKPRLDRFLSEEQKQRINPEKVDFSGIPPIKKPEKKPEMKLEKVKTDNSTVMPSYHDTTIPLNQDEIIEIIRKAVKHLGKEAATYRFTLEEKKGLADIVYSYKGGGIRTSENEITRIAINFLVEDYRNNRKNSILAKVIERLNE